MVGAVRFELTTSCTRNKRATRLRYAPTSELNRLPTRDVKGNAEFQEQNIFAVERHHLRLKTVRLNLRLKMRAPVLHHGANAPQVFPQHGHFGARRDEVVAILLAQVAGDVAGDLRVEVNAIHHDDDCGIVELRMQPRLLRGKTMSSDLPLP